MEHCYLQECGGTGNQNKCLEISRDVCVTHARRTFNTFQYVGYSWFDMTHMYFWQPTDQRWSGLKTLSEIGAFSPGGRHSMQHCLTLTLVTAWFILPPNCTRYADRHAHNFLVTNHVKWYNLTVRDRVIAKQTGLFRWLASSFLGLYSFETIKFRRNSSSTHVQNAQWW